MSVEERIKGLSVRYFQGTSAFEGLQKTVSQLEQAEEIAYRLQNKDENDVLTIIKIGTVLSLAVVEKIAKGKSPKAFSNDDWKDVAQKVADMAILSDGQSYTEWVFTFYSRYLDASIKINKTIIPGKHLEDLQALSDELKKLTSGFQQGSIKETDYVEECLWICFEAMIKLISSYAFSSLKPEFGDFLVASADFVVQFARLGMYKREDALLSAYLEHQEALDENLQRQYDDYIAELEERSQRFESLIRDAYSTDFRERLMSTASLAKEAGVDEEKILDSISKIDDFFG